MGAPLGRYPGGLDLPLNSSVCELYDEGRGVPVRNTSTLTDGEIRECYLRTGLVYTCPLTGTSGCGPLLGNMDAYGADVLCLIVLVSALMTNAQMSTILLGNVKQKNQFDQFIIQQEKIRQRMGNTLFSSGEFFVVCM